MCPCPYEVEAKWRLKAPEQSSCLREQLKNLGADPKGSHVEFNRLFDRSNKELRKSGKVLRVRVLDGGPQAVLTLKGRAQYESGIKRRLEFELRIDDADTIQALLGELGYSATNEYPKLREAWGLETAEVTLDELPFGHFCEIQGTDDMIKRVAGALRLDLADCESKGYPSLMHEFVTGRRDPGVA